VTVVGGILAHQGGWDEILFVAAPLVVLASLLVLANRRADAALDEEAPPDPDEPGR
jgi:predicted MFS family arabinose efflux permease